MTRRAVTSALMVKEVRALLPTWTAAAGAVGVAAIVSNYGYRPLAVLAFAIGCFALGAQSVGHEYTQRTMGLLLSQPIHRWRVMAVKLAVLTAMLLSLAALAWNIFILPAGVRVPPVWFTPRALGLTVASALVVAPWLTLLARRPMAGVVFTMAIPAGLFILGDAIGALMYGPQNAGSVDHFAVTFFYRSMTVLIVAAGLLAMRTFMRLEVIEGRDTDVDLGWWLPRRPLRIGARADRDRVRIRRPVRNLFMKELRLQQMPLVVAGLYVLIWSVLGGLEQRVPGFAPPPFAPIAVLYVIVLSLLVGSLTSAEERHLGTLEPQVLAPIATSKQWAIKVSVALALPLVLGVALAIAVAAVLAYGFNSSAALGLIQDDPIRAVMSALGIVALSVCITTVSIYVSSLCSSGLRALVVSLPVALCGSLLIPMIAWAVESAVRSLLPTIGRFGTGGTVAPLAIGGSLVCLALWMAFRNHCSADRSPVHVARQAAWIVAGLVTGVAVTVILSGI
jgi:ABC-type transport system involved in multi-copper enzyme maturation permease subunit